MCHSCLKLVFELSLINRTLMPPRCCSAEFIGLATVGTLFNTEFKSDWNRKYQEFTTEDPLYCPQPDCGKWIKSNPTDCETVFQVRCTDSHGREHEVCCTCGAYWDAVGKSHHCCTQPRIKSAQKSVGAHDFSTVVKLVFPPGYHYCCCDYHDALEIRSCSSRVYRFLCLPLCNDIVFNPPLSAISKAEQFNILVSFILYYILHGVIETHRLLKVPRWGRFYDDDERQKHEVNAYDLIKHVRATINVLKDVERGDEFQDYLRRRISIVALIGLPP